MNNWDNRFNNGMVDGYMNHPGQGSMPYGHEGNINGGMMGNYGNPMYPQGNISGVGGMPEQPPVDSGLIFDPMTGKMRKPRKPGKQEVINWFKQNMNCMELDLVDETFDEVARHICFGGKTIELLPKQVFMFQWEGGQIPLEYYQCQKCGKIMLNRNFM